MWRRFKALLGSRVDAASLALFRICFGTVILGEAYRLLKTLPGDTTRLEYYFTGDVKWNFPFHGLEWVTPLPEPWLSVTCWALGVAGLTLAWGLFSRLSAAVIFVTWTYLLLLDECRFNNHYYLQSLFAFLLIWIPSGNCFSFDRGFREMLGRVDPDVSPTVPFWSIFLLRAQLAIVYIYGGVAKLTVDWFNEAQPMRIVLESTAERWGDASAAGMPGVVYAFLTWAPLAFFFAYAGVLFDFSIAFLLLIPRTRVLGLVFLIVFHGLNHWLLFADIGLFPVMAVTSSLIFLAPDWPRRFFAWLKHRTFKPPDVAWLITGAIIVPVIGAALGWKLKSDRRALPAEEGQPRPSVVVFVCLWLCLQTLIPLRHYLIAGDVNWTEEGGRWSWRMKGVARRARSTHIVIEDPEIIRLDDSGQAVVERTHWNGSPVIYRQVVARHVDWQKLPEVVVVMQPLVGELVFFNPLAGGGYTSVAEAQMRINQIWEEVYGRRPTAIVEAKSLRETLAAAESEVSAVEGGRALVSVFRESRRLAKTLEDENLPSDEVWRAVQKLRRNINSLVANPRYGGIVRQHVARSYPLSLHGGLAQAPFLTIEDVPLHKMTRERVVTLDRDAWKIAWPGAEEVVVDLDSLTPFERKLIPPVFLTIDELGRAGIGWDQSHDLAEYQNRWFAIDPFMVRQYAREIARRWQQEHGRYPKVYVIEFVKMNQYPARLLIDPYADLASEPVHLFRHNDWILPFHEQRNETKNPSG